MKWAKSHKFAIFAAILYLLSALYIIAVRHETGLIHTATAIVPIFLLLVIVSDLWPRKAKNSTSDDGFELASKASREMGKQSAPNS